MEEMSFHIRKLIANVSYIVHQATDGTATFVQSQENNPDAFMQRVTPKSPDVSGFKLDCQDVLAMIKALANEWNLPEYFVQLLIAAVVIAMGVMLLAATTVATFIERHPTTKMLALSFLLLVGVALVADGLGFHIPRGYLYFAIAFSLLVETLNIFARRSRTEGDPDT